MKLPRQARSHTRQRTVSDANGLMKKAALVSIMSAMVRRLLNQRVRRSNHAVGSRSERFRPIVGHMPTNTRSRKRKTRACRCSAKYNTATDHNTFRFPKASGIGTHPQGMFTVNPDMKPKQVDSIAEGGAHGGQLTRGIYEILDATDKRPCWRTPGGLRPTEFKSAPGSGWILQDWKKIEPVPSG